MKQCNLSSRAQKWIMHLTCSFLLYYSNIFFWILSARTLHRQVKVLCPSFDLLLPRIISTLSIYFFSVHFLIFILFTSSSSFDPSFHDKYNLVIFFSPIRHMKKWYQIKNSLKIISIYLECKTSRHTMAPAPTDVLVVTTWGLSYVLNKIF